MQLDVLRLEGDGAAQILDCLVETPHVHGRSSLCPERSRGAAVDDDGSTEFTKGRKGTVLQKVCLSAADE